MAQGVEMRGKKGHKVLLALQVVYRTCKGSFKKYVSSDRGSGSLKKRTKTNIFKCVGGG